MTFLQLLSTRAEQRVTYRCHASVAHMDAGTKSLARAAVLMTFNDLELVAKKSKFKYNVLEDGCRVGVLTI